MNPTLEQIAQALRTSSKASHLSRILDKLTIDIEWLANNKNFASFGPSGYGQLKLIATESVWCDVFSKMPPVGRQSLGAMRRLCAEFQVQGNEVDYLQALPFLEQLIEDARAQLHGEVKEQEFDDLSVLQGSFVKLKSGAWVYQETTGKKDAPTILMLHTAGADTRQWHGLMTIPEIRQQWNLVAFDVPGHGRSPLPVGQENWNWLLNEKQYMAWVIEFIEATQLKNVVLMGCSMGAAISLGLLATFSEHFSGGILLETPYRSPGRRSPYLDHPKVHGNRLAATWVASLLSPQSPKVRRDYAKWIYSQGAPSVYDGDLAFYSDEFAASKHTNKINTAKTPLWLLTGDYDYSASPEETMKVVNEIPGARFIRLNGFGHFPMTEDPKRLYKEYLQEVLERCSQMITS